MNRDGRKGTMPILAGIVDQRVAEVELIVGACGGRVKQPPLLFLAAGLVVYSPPYMDTFFIPSERIMRPEKGKVALISQSGGILVDHMVKLAGEGVGVSMAVSIGNKALLGEIDLLHYFTNDPETNVIAFYIEGFAKREGREFVLKARQCPKPVVVLKAGKTSLGVKAVSSHTASMAGDYEVFSSVLAQHGVVEAKDEFELIPFCEALSCYQ